MFSISVNGRQVPIQAFADSETIEVKSLKSWWKIISNDTIEVICRDGKVVVIMPKNLENFYDKWLKGIEPSLESPFSVVVTESEDERA